MSFPFGNQNSEEMSVEIADFFTIVSSKIEDKIIALNSYIFIKSKAPEKSYWSLLQEEKYPCLKDMDLPTYAKQHFLI